jgi:hypothetical protein
MMYQVNQTIDFDGYLEYFISEYSEDGYRGRLINSTADGNTYTDWCIFKGTLDECMEYLRQRS